VHGVRNKGQAMPAQAIQTAHDRMADWLERNKA
jgi:hypothetical protein